MDSEDIAELVRAHAAELERFAARRVAVAADAADVAQSAWCRLLERAPTAAPTRDPRRFLFTVVLNLIRDRARGARRAVAGRRALEPLLETIAPGAEQAALARERRRALVQAVSSLSPRARAALLLFRVEGLSYREIGQRLGISPRTVEHHLRHAMIELHRRLAGEREL